MAQMSVFLLLLALLQICFVEASIFMGGPRKLQTEYLVSWKDYWTQKFPSTPPPREMASLASPLNVLEARALAQMLQVAQSNPGAFDSPFCRNYGFLCGSDVHGPLVCIGPYWYMYTDRAKCAKLESRPRATESPQSGPVSTPYQASKNATIYHETKNTTTFHEAKNSTVFHETKNNTIFRQDRNVTIFHDSGNNTIYHDPLKNFTAFHGFENDTIVGESKNDTKHHTSSLFFRPTYLVENSKIIFPKLDNNLQGRSFLPAPLAALMPLDADHLGEYMKLYEVPENSNMATSMDSTLSFCNSSTKEVRSCHASLESMVDFVLQEMGSNVVPIVLGYSPSYSIEVELMATPIALSSTDSTSITCHDLMFPYLVYGCHVIPNSLVHSAVLHPLKDGPSFHAPYVCHMNTSSWDPFHMAFIELNAQPGDGPICHWVPQNNFIWISA